MAAKDTTSKIFVVCGRDADLLYEAELNPSFDAESPTAHLSHFVLHAALDNVDHLIATTPDVYLRVVDNFNEKRVYAFCTGGHAKFLLLHEGRNEDAVRNGHDCARRPALNPFYIPDSESHRHPSSGGAARRYQGTPVRPSLWCPPPCAREAPRAASCCTRSSSSPGLVDERKRLPGDQTDADAEEQRVRTLASPGSCVDTARVPRRRRPGCTPIVVQLACPWIGGTSSTSNDMPHLSHTRHEDQDSNTSTSLQASRVQAPVGKGRKTAPIAATSPCAPLRARPGVAMKPPPEEEAAPRATSPEHTTGKATASSGRS